MQRVMTMVCAAGIAALATSGLALAADPPAAKAEAPKNPVAEGKEIAMDRKLGNCASCHVIAGAESPGEIGPPLVAMQARFPDKAVLRAQIEDATRNNPNSLMPPFGRHKILSKDQIDKVVEYIYSL